MSFKKLVLVMLFGILLLPIAADVGINWAIAQSGTWWSESYRYGNWWERAHNFGKFNLFDKTHDTSTSYSFPGGGECGSVCGSPGVYGSSMPASYQSGPSYGGNGGISMDYSPFGYYGGNDYGGSPRGGMSYGPGHRGRDGSMRHPDRRIGRLHDRNDRSRPHMRGDFDRGRSHGDRPMMHGNRGFHGGRVDHPRGDMGRFGRHDNPPTKEELDKFGIDDSVPTSYAKFGRTDNPPTSAQLNKYGVSDTVLSEYAEYGDSDSDIPTID